jgi:ATP-dependent helicase HepA
MNIFESDPHGKVIDYSSHYLINGFVRLPCHDDDIGKIIDSDDGVLTVELFDNPSVPIEKLLVPAHLEYAIPIDLYRQTRIYCETPRGDRWYIGRVAVSEPKGCVVRFPNVKDSVSVPLELIHVRRHRSVADPIGPLRMRQTETTYFHDKRSSFLKALFHQRQAARGMTALLSSSIDLEPHQITVVRRVLSDPIKRYLLADEVGLGKTIEAGVIARQHLLDNFETARILILCPKHLTHQWNSELSRRFIPNFAMDTQIQVISPEDSEILEILNNTWTMLVVDEAHQFAGRKPNDEINGRIYEHLLALCERVDTLLMLSATPAIHNERGFFNMLRLLDPHSYPENSFPAFKERIEMRQEIADAYHLLAEDPDKYELKDLSDRLMSLLPGDSYLTSLIREHILPRIPEAELEGDNELENYARQMRIHLSETHRLYRRMLRSRRTGDVLSLTPERKGFVQIGYEDPLREILVQAIEHWRVELTMALTPDDPGYPKETQFYMAMVEALWEGPVAFYRLLSERQFASTGKTSRMCREESLLKEMMEVAQQLIIEDPLLNKLSTRVNGLLKTHMNHENERKIVIFASDPKEADRIAEYLITSLGASKIARHSPPDEDMYSETSSPEWMRFVSESLPRVLICDRTAEEGLNLQGTNNCRFSSAVIFHWDLPLNPNRIEQRLGRLDRYGMSFPIHNMAMVHEKDNIGRMWARILDESYNVFQVSIASLQYFINTQMKQLAMELPADGLDALMTMAHRTTGPDGEITKEMGRIRNQEILDSLETDNSENEDYIDALEEIDLPKQSDKCRVAIEGWVCNALKFGRHYETQDNNRGPVRYIYHSQRTLLPVDQLERYFPITMFDTDWRQFRNQDPATEAMSYRRPQAQTTGTRMAWIGEPFIDAMEAYARADERGAAFSIWRVSSDWPEKEATLAFRFDYLIELGSDRLADALAEYSPSSSLVRNRADELFPPLTYTIWLDRELESIRDEHLLEVLALPYFAAKRVRHANSYSDYNLNYQRWQIIDTLEDISTWEYTIEAANKKASDLLPELIDLESHIEKARQRVDERFRSVQDQLTSRLSYMEKEWGQAERKTLEIENLLHDASLASLNEIQITLDAAGAIFVSSHNPFQ